MKIQVLGTGCPKCKKMAELAEAAAADLGLNYELVKVTGISEIRDCGVRATPRLAVDANVLAAGGVPTPEQMKRLLAQAAGK